MMSTVQLIPAKKELTVVFGGDWSIEAPFENASDFETLAKSPFSAIVFSGESVRRWDSSFVATILHFITVCKKEKKSYRFEKMPDGALPLIELALKVPPRDLPPRANGRKPFLDALGETSLSFFAGCADAFSFCRQARASLRRFLCGKAVLRKNDLWLALQEAGANALPIVSLICFMIGLIVAFVGSIQLKLFGAQIYVASLVAIAVTRVMGAIMAGVIMSGRTGASYAATIGSMQVNEEVDALETMGISPFDFLVTPRLLALSLMMPFLTVYADITGILGGAFVGIVMLDLSPEEYVRATLNALKMRHVLVGIAYGASYGVIIALCGCFQGIRCGRNASAVGKATTSAVVVSIVLMTVDTAILTFLFNMFGV